MERDYPVNEAQPPCYPQGMPKMGMCDEPKRERRDPARLDKLFEVAKSIAAIVESQVRPGGERCQLRQLVEMILEFR